MLLLSFLFMLLKTNPPGPFVKGGKNPIKLGMTKSEVLISFVI